MATAFRRITESEWLNNRITRSRSGVFSEVVELTPAMAGELLSRNPENRPVRSRRVDAYAKDIREGRWAFNGEPIIVSREGLLNDGQHRCGAVVEAEAPIRTLMVFGLDRETRKTTDIGAAKNAGAFAAMDGIPNANTVAGIARVAVAHRDLGNVHLAARVTNTEVSELIEKDCARLVEAASLAQGLQHHLRGMVSGTPFGFLYYTCKQIDAEAAEEFFRSVATGEMLASDDPAFVVRNRLRSLGQAGRSAKIEVMAHGWNAFRRGQKRTFIRVQGSMPELV